MLSTTDIQIGHSPGPQDTEEVENDSLFQSLAH